jgi:hypothetical protein
MVRAIPGVHVPDIFDEVSEDLRAERAQRLLQRYGFLLVIAAVLIIAGAGGWQAWRWRQGQNRAAVATSFLTAMRQSSSPLGAETPARTQAMQTLAQMGAEGPSGYRTLARLREAALKVSAGDLPAALALWNQISADEGADIQLRHLADLLWVQHQIDAGDPAAVEGRLAPLIAPGEPWRPLALESQAWLKLRTGDTKGAVAVLREIAALPSAPDGVRTRANGLLLRLGETPGGQAADPEKQG